MKADADRAHSPTPLSSAYRWLECPGSVPFAETLTPMPASKAMDEGTAAHTAAIDGSLAAAIKCHVDYLIHCNRDSDLESFVEHVLALRAKHRPSRVLLEHRVTLDESLDLFGTLDVAMRTSRTTAVIVDLKWGAGYAVQAENNPQLAGYAAGLNAMYGPFDSIEVQIFQPRAYDPVMPIRSWTLDAEDIKDWTWKLREGANVVRSMIAGGRDTWRFQTGDHCRTCPCAGVCGAFKAHTDEILPGEVPSVVEAVQKTFPGAVMTGVITPPDASALTPDQVARVIKGAPMIRAFLDAVERRGLVEGLQGSPPPGLKVVRGKARRYWKDDAGGALEALGVDPWKRSMRGLGEIEKALGKGKIDDLVVKRDGGPTLVPLDDPRLPFVSGVAGADFPDDVGDE